MRTVVAICLIALIATTFASHSKSHSHKKSFSKIDSALSLTQGLKMLVETAQEDETREVRRVLDSVRDEVNGILENTKERYATEEANYEDVKASYLDQLQQFQTNLEQTQVALQYANDEIDQLTEAIAESQASIADAQAQKDTENARRAASHEAFQSHWETLEEADQAVEDALKLILEIDNEDLEEAFLQLNNKKIYKNAKQINHIIKHLGTYSHMNSFAATFLEVASQGINQDLVDKLTTLLVALGEQINAAIDEAVGKDNADDAYSRAVLGNLDNTIEVQESAIADNTGYLNGYLEDAENLEQEEQTWTDYLQDTGAHYEAFQEQWEEKSQNYEKLIQRLEDDLVALDAADNFLDS